MLITKFNRMIRNKVLWGIFAFFISLSFVITLAPQGSGAGASGDASAGKIFGEDVDFEEFRTARFFAAGLQPMDRLEPEERDQLEDRTWTRLAMRRVADRMRVQVADAEVQARIAADPSFLVNNQFSPERYQQLLRQVVGIPESLFEDYLRENIRLEKVYATVSTATWVPPSELRRQVRDFTDRFTVDIAVFERDRILTNTFEIADEDARAYYEREGERFREPPRLSLYSVRFPYAAETGTVAVTDAEITAHFDANSADFRIAETSLVAQAHEEDGAPITFETNVTDRALTWEEAAPRIRPLLLDRKAKARAAGHAAEFLNRLLPPDGRPVDFVTAAAQAGLAIHTTQPFSASESIPGMEDAGIALNREAFRLDPTDPQRAFGDPISGEDAVYMIAVHEQFESHIPPMESVRTAVDLLARAAAMEGAFRSAITGLHAVVTAQLTDGLAFSNAAPVVSMGSVTSVTFTLAEVYYGESAPNPLVRSLLPDIVAYRAGDIAEPIIEQDRALFCRVVARDPMPPGEAELHGQEIRRMLERQYATGTVAAWERAILKAAGYTPSGRGRG